VRRRLSKRFFYRETANGNVFFRARDGDQIAGERLHQRSLDIVVNRLAFGVTFTCFVDGRVTVLTTDARESSGKVVGSYFSARLGRELLATEVLREQGDSFFRISSRCRRQ
jgi:hypothetical protein